MAYACLTKSFPILLEPSLTKRVEITFITAWLSEENIINTKSKIK
jgi:hypothetical protein